LGRSKIKDILKKIGVRSKAEGKEKRVKAKKN